MRCPLFRCWGTRRQSSSFTYRGASFVPRHLWASYSFRIPRILSSSSFSEPYVLAMNVRAHKLQRADMGSPGTIGANSKDLSHFVMQASAHRSKLSVCDRHLALLARQVLRVLLRLTCACHSHPAESWRPCQNRPHRRIDLHPEGTSKRCAMPISPCVFPDRKSVV